ncbi:MAG: hypothetical protein DME26_04605 [Verrucomicrobia bacterium]|nr:MAG: hypothetical protein DME26_04605 [Verrucomicrobiota bacterium]
MNSARLDCSNVLRLVLRTQARSEQFVTHSRGFVQFVSAGIRHWNRTAKAQRREDFFGPRPVPGRSSPHASGSSGRLRNPLNMRTRCAPGQRAVLFGFTVVPNHTATGALTYLSAS